eukprot:TRINITY_DN91264_c0_g1_i1.p1 TRINITY_DN91264_c0_g1~~TRINITY_DN91264_c0_g1_i1.p1  ORF type:complete len:445 (-),score=71.92 TRINITY_DN91264_c0_g1_i1:130-1464(-)
MVAESGMQDLLLASVASVAKLVLVCSVGILAGLFPRAPRKPILHKAAMADLSHLMVYVCWPAWAFWAVGSGIRLEEMTSTLWLMVWCMFHSLVALSLGFAAAKLACVDKELRPAFVVGCGFCNSAAVPLLLLEPLCQQPALRHIEDCVRKSNGCVMLYTMIWTMLFFCIGVPMLETAGAERDKSKDGPAKLPEIHAATAAETPKKEKSLAVNEGDIELQDSEEGGEHDASRRSRSSEGQVTAGTIEQPGAKAMLWSKKLMDLLYKALSSPPMIATLLGLGVVFVPPVQHALFHPDGPLMVVGSALQTLQAPAVTCFSMIMAASLVPTEELRARCKVHGWPVKLSVISIFLVVRLVLAPAICIGAWYAVEIVFLQRESSPSNQLVQLVTLVESLAPAANMPVVFLAKMEKHDVGTRLAFIYVFMYPLAVLTMTGYSTLSLQLVLG